MTSYKETLDKMTFEQTVDVRNYIDEELSSFLEGLRTEVLGLFPYTSKEYVEHEIDIAVEEAADWDW